MCSTVTHRPLACGDEIFSGKDTVFITKNTLMEFSEFLTSTYTIAALFFIVAFVYSSVGLGGGSSYTALMTIFGFSTLVIPLVSLSLNLIVTTIGSINFARSQHARLRLILPFLVTSVPMAYVGGSLNLPKDIFYWVLLVSLGLVAARIYFWESVRLNLQPGSRAKLLISLLVGSVLGLLAGVTGIGGGVFLVPLIIVFGLGTEKEAAACGAIFVWLNSLFGLASRLQYNAINMTEYVPLVAAVVVGGVLGSYLGAFKLAPRAMEKILGVIILFAIAALGRKLLVL
jgi:uncharacterized membrane protein YfcA